MKSQTLPVKRRPVPKGVFRRLSAVTRNRKQRAAAAAPANDIDDDDGSSKISRALTIIFLIHIVAIGLIFVHQRFLDDRPEEQAAAPKAAAKVSTARVVPRLKPGDKGYFVQTGDNWSRIAAAHGVDEAELRKANPHVEISTGHLVIIPPKRIVAEDPPEVVAIREQSLPDIDQGLVPAVDVSNAPKARLVRPNISAPAAGTSSQSYVVQPGDSIWRIANRFNVSQDALMKANGIKDARKMRAGMKLAIPQP